ncbi:hypothetical protein JXM83_02220 [Candidatus Woesearchaeota archaeon]|nr:hypothetical protein [Candidatus Woesearchaeota archaeon]
MESLDLNIFNYATKELSLDAFLSWLLAHYNYPKSELYEIAKRFIAKIIDNIKLPSTIDIKLQEKKRDITIYLMNNKSDIYHVIFIEDKMDTSIHDSQIQRYFKDIKNYSITPVFFKLGYLKNQEIVDLSNIKKDITNLIIFSQKEIFNLFNVKTSNKLYNDWFEYFNSINISNIEINNSTKLDLLTGPSFLKSKFLKLKILDLFGQALNNEYSIGTYHNSAAIYCWIYPEKIKNSRFEYMISILNDKISLHLHAYNKTQSEINNIIKELKNSKFWKPINHKKSIATVKTLVDFTFSFGELKELFSSAIIEMNYILNLPENNNKHF